MIRDKENDKVIFEFSRNSETYQMLSECIDFPYDKWEDVNQDKLQITLNGIEKDVSDLQQKIIFDILKTDDFFEINNSFNELKQMIIVLGRVYSVINYTLYEDCDWCFA